MMSHPVIALEENYMEDGYQQKARKIIVEMSDAFVLNSWLATLG